MSPWPPELSTPAVPEPRAAPGRTWRPRDSGSCAQWPSAVAGLPSAWQCPVPSALPSARQCPMPGSAQCSVPCPMPCPAQCLAVPSSLCPALPSAQCRGALGALGALGPGLDSPANRVANTIKRPVRSLCLARNNHSDYKETFQHSPYSLVWS